MSGELPDPFDWQTAPEFNSGSQPLPDRRPYADWGFEETFTGTEAEPAVVDTDIPPTTPATRPVDSDAPRSPRLKNRVLAAVAAGICVVGILATIGELDNGKGHKSASKPVATACDPGLKDIRQVETAFKGHPFAVNIQTAARLSGLHVVSNGLNGDFGTGAYAADSVQQLTDKARNDLRPYGISLQIGSGYVHPDGIDLSTPKPRELSQNLDTTLGEIAQPFPGLPIELARLTGIKKIVMMANSNPNSDLFAENGGTVFWNIDLRQISPAMSEALYYGLDSTECPDEQGENDPAYAALNGRNVYVKPLNRGNLLALDHFTTDDAWPVAANIDGFLSSHNTAVERAAGQSSRQQYCGLIDGFMRRIATVYEGGFEDAAQDKNGIGGFLLYMNNDSASLDNALLDPASPILRSKTEFLLARLNHLNPRIVRYMADVNGSTAPTSSQCE